MNPPILWFVYELQDADGRALYVGLTRDVSQRIKAHSYKPYWADVCGVRVEMVHGWNEGRARERERITELAPPLNREHQPWGEVEGAPCHFFRFCGAEATTDRTYGDVGRHPRRVRVCDEHSRTKVGQR